MMIFYLYVMSFTCEDQKIYIYVRKRKLYLESKIAVNRSEELVIIYSLFLTVSQVSVDIKILFSIKNSKSIEQGSSIFQVHYHRT